jgi:hypothetical protein
VINNDKPDDFFQAELNNLFPKFAGGSWGECAYLHRQALRDAANAAIALMVEADRAFRKIDADVDLTTDAKKRRRFEVGAEYLEKLSTSKMVAKAKEAAESVLQKYQAKIEAPLNLQDETRGRLPCMYKSAIGFTP